MQVYAIFHGGRSYSTYWTARDVEQFDSLREARSVFEARADFDPYYPCTDEGAEMWLFFYNPVEEGSLISDPYPDRILSLGPRGGVRECPA